MAETYPNRFHMHSAATDRLHNFDHPSDSGSDLPGPSELPTIWDRLTAAGRTGQYYYGDTPFLALWGARYLNISFPFPQFYVDAAAGLLPDVAFIDPRFKTKTPALPTTIIRTPISGQVSIFESDLQCTNDKPELELDCPGN